MDTSRSSWIDAATFLQKPGAETGYLVIEYNGEVWTYLDVPTNTWIAFTEAESLGKFFAEEIKGNFSRKQEEPLWVHHKTELVEPFAAHVQCAFNQDCEAVLLELLGKAEHSVLVAAYAFTRTRVAEALARAKQRGAEVEVKIDSRQAEYPAAAKMLEYLEKQGIPITRIRVPGEYSAMHNKFMVIDDRYVITGSYNYSTLAHVANWENILWADSSELAAQYRQAWMGIQSR